MKALPWWAPPWYYGGPDAPRRLRTGIAYVYVCVCVLVCVCLCIHIHIYEDVSNTMKRILIHYK